MVPPRQPFRKTVCVSEPIVVNDGHNTRPGSSTARGAPLTTGTPRKEVSSVTRSMKHVVRGIGLLPLTREKSLECPQKDSVRAPGVSPEALGRNGDREDGVDRVPLVGRSGVLRETGRWTKRRRSSYLKVKRLQITVGGYDSLHPWGRPCPRHLTGGTVMSTVKIDTKLSDTPG